MISPRHYLCVFHANPAVEDDVADIGRDPDFSEPPTWGICRPPVRSTWVDIGSYILFIGYYKDRLNYLVKGWIRVGEKITYPDALNRFPDRPNVIIRPRQALGSGYLPRIIWKRKNLEELFLRLHRDAKPLFLTSFNVGGSEYVQRPEDEHESDNWKCQRMFLCKHNQLKKCVELNKCELESNFPGWDQYRGYVVADLFKEVGKHRIDIKSLVSKSQVEFLRTPKGQHNPIRLTDSMFRDIRDSLSKFS